jgi:GAF domain-containing protein/HAMP domain-containing protein
MTLSQQKIPFSLSRFETIRTRLIVAFLAVALLPLIGISFIFLASGAQGGQEQAVNQLDTVASYKENALQSWASALKIELNNALLGENTISNIQKFIQTPPASPEAMQIRDVYNAIQERFVSQVRQSQYYEELFLLNMDGRVVLSTNNTQEGQIYADRDFFLVGQQSLYIEAPFYNSALGRTMIFAAEPIYNEQRQVVGVLAGRARPSPVTDIINDRTGLGETGVTYLVSMDRTLLFGLDPDIQGQQIHAEGVLAAFEGRTTGSRAYRNALGVPVIGIYRWLPNLEAVLVAEQDRIESARGTYAGLAINISVGLSSILVALFLALLVTRTIATPVADLAETATLIAAGERELSAPIEREDEIGILAQAFNSMTAQLNAFIGELEQRVAQRTHELEVRSSYLEASAEVSRSAASILDPDQLVEQAAQFIQERFNLYYVGLFLVDERKEWAVLHAGTGEAGAAMLERGHRLPVGGASMIGWCINNAQARIAQEAATDVVRIATPELPNTRSEAALPLRSRGQVIGAVSVQSEQPNAFDETSISVLQSMADQVAVAIDNARLFAVSQRALEAERRAYTTQSRLSWEAWLKSQANYSLRATEQGISRTELIWQPEMDHAFHQNKTIGTEQNLAIPIRVRSSVIGVLNVSHNTQGGSRAEWTADEIAFLEGVAEQLGIALDSARLYAETQQRAEQERLVSRATSRMRESLDVETVLKTAIDEIYQALHLENLVIQLNPQIEGPDQDDSNNGHEVVPDANNPTPAVIHTDREGGNPGEAA